MGERPDKAWEAKEGEEVSGVLGTMGCLAHWEFAPGRG